MLSRRALTDDSSAAVDGAVLLTSSGAALDIVHGAKLVSAKAASQQRPGGTRANREFGDGRSKSGAIAIVDEALLLAWRGGAITA